MKNVQLDERAIEASALLEGFTIPEMEEVIEADIFELMGVSEKLSKDQKEDLIIVFQDTINKRVLSRVLSQLPEDNRQEFIKMAESKPEEAEEYLIEKDINKDQILIAETILYKLELSNKQPR